MFAVYSPELKQIQAYTRFTDVAAHLAAACCERENDKRRGQDEISFQVWEVEDVQPPAPSGSAWRHDTTPQGRLVGTVTMQRRGWEPWVTAAGWSW